jgi:hypothetical protein
MPKARFGAATCAVGSDIYVFGGHISDIQAHSSVFKFDTEANEWSTLAPMPHPCCYHSANLLDGVVSIVGAAATHHRLMRFNPASGAWRTLAPTSTRKLGEAAFVIGGSLYAAGSLENGKSLEQYSVATDTCAAAMADMPVGRGLFAAVAIKSAGSVEEHDIFDELIAKAPKKNNRVKVY